MARIDQPENKRSAGDTHQPEAAGALHLAAYASPLSLIAWDTASHSSSSSHNRRIDQTAPSAAHVRAGYLEIPPTPGQSVPPRGEQPPILERQWNVAKNIGLGAYDRLSDDVTNFGQHPIRSSAEIAGTTIAGAAIVYGSVEAGLATAAYVGLDALSTQMGALFGATSAAALIGPSADAAATKTAQDWHATAGARQTLMNPQPRTADQLATAEQIVRQTLGRDALTNLEIYAPLLAGVAGAELSPSPARPTSLSSSAISRENTPLEPFSNQRELNIARPLSPLSRAGFALDSDGRISHLDGAGLDRMDVQYDSSGAASQLHITHGQSEEYSLIRQGDHWIKSGDPGATSYQVQVDQSTGILITGDGSSTRYQPDGQIISIRQNGYSETRSGNYFTDQERLNKLHLPGGIELEQQRLPNGNSRIQLSEGEQTWLSEPGNFTDGWNFTTKNGEPPVPGAKGTSAHIGIGKEIVEGDGDDSGWGLTVRSGKSETTYTGNGWRQQRIELSPTSWEVHVTNHKGQVRVFWVDRPATALHHP